MTDHPAKAYMAELARIKGEVDEELRKSRRAFPIREACRLDRMGITNVYAVAKSEPQGLKPNVYARCSGTTEVVPSPDQFSGLTVHFPVR